MPEMLYICKRPGQGVARIWLEKVTGATGLTLTRGRRVGHHDFKTNSTVINPTAPAGGEPVITLHVEGRDDYALVDWPDAVAATAFGLFFWREDGRWSHDPTVDATTAPSAVEARCSPVYDLPE
jgi:hypothetical protein